MAGLLLILVLIISGIFLLGAKGDEWFNHAPPRRVSKGRDILLFNEEGEFVDDYVDRNIIDDDELLDTDEDMGISDIKAYRFVFEDDD